MHYRRYSLHESGEIMYQLAREPIATTAARLGRTPNALRQYVRRTQTSNIQRHARRAAGMSHRDVSVALGVDHQRVTSWVKLGWLVADTSYGVRAGYVTYRMEAVSAFLTTRGGALLPYLRPTGAWVGEVAAARASLEARYISRAALCQLLSVTNGSIQYWQRRKAFPAAALRFGRCLSTYFERDAVRAWLDARAFYWTRAAREGL